MFSCNNDACETDFIAPTIQGERPKSNLPIIFISTPKQMPITSKEKWMDNVMMCIARKGEEQEADTILDYTIYSDVKIKGRGNTTWFYPKKPYTIKFSEEVSLLGMPKHRNWVLLANWIDKTCLRNAIAFEIARSTSGLSWTPRGEWVELVVNEKFMGNYYLCEQIKPGRERLDISNPSSEIENDPTSCSFVLELDINYGETNKFRSNHGTYYGIKGLPVNIKEPSDNELTAEQFNEIKNFFCSTEEAIYSSNRLTTREYSKHIDINSFIDWWFVHELTYNSEPDWPKSCYMHKNVGGKLKMGPVWDFDYATFRPDRTGFACKKSLWYPLLFSDSSFIDELKKLWKMQKSGVENIVTFIDSSAVRIKTSAETNAELWPIDRKINMDENLSFDEAVARLRQFYIDRVAWLDKQISRL